jgi:hypothetical protein
LAKGWVFRQSLLAPYWADRVRKIIAIYQCSMGEFLATENRGERAVLEAPSEIWLNR